MGVEHRQQEPAVAAVIGSSGSTQEELIEGCGAWKEESGEDQQQVIDRQRLKDFDRLRNIEIEVGCCRPSLHTAAEAAAMMSTHLLRPSLVAEPASRANIISRLHHCTCTTDSLLSDPRLVKMFELLPTSCGTIKGILMGRSAIPCIINRFPSVFLSNLSKLIPPHFRRILNRLQIPSRWFSLLILWVYEDPLVAASGIGTGPPGESGRRAVRTSTPSSVTKRVCSVDCQFSFSRVVRVETHQIVQSSFHLESRSSNHRAMSCPCTSPMQPSAR